MPQKSNLGLFTVRSVCLGCCFRFNTFRNSLITHDTCHRNLCPNMSTKPIKLCVFFFFFKSDSQCQQDELPRSSPSPPQLPPSSTCHGIGSSGTCCSLFVVTVAPQLFLLLFFIFSKPSVGDLWQTSLTYIKRIECWQGDRLAIWQTSNAGPLDPADPMTRLGIMCKDVSISVFSLAQEVDFP